MCFTFIGVIDRCIILFFTWLNGILYIKCFLIALSFYLGCFFFVGAALPGELRPHHKSVFDFDEVRIIVILPSFSPYFWLGNHLYRTFIVIVLINRFSLLLFWTESNVDQCFNVCSHSGHRVVVFIVGSLFMHEFTCFLNIWETFVFVVKGSTNLGSE